MLLKQHSETNDARVLKARSASPNWGIEGDLITGEEFLASIALGRLHHKQDIHAIVVQHIVPNSLPFINVLARFCRKITLIAKPNSIDSQTLQEIGKQLPNVEIADVRRRDLHGRNGVRFARAAEKSGKTVIFDMGGYFSDVLPHSDFNELPNLLGIIEDTQNGHQRYVKQIARLEKRLHFPIYSVADSPLKDAEDFLVGASIVEACERGLSEIGSSLLNRRVGVLGYGKIGRSIANAVRRKVPRVAVFDPNAIQSIQARAHGFEIQARKKLLQKSDIIFCASGNKSICAHDIKLLRAGSVLVSCTSKDDEFGFEVQDTPSDGDTENEKIRSKIIRSDSNEILLLGGGNAINFIYGNNVGPYIFLVMAEMISCLSSVISNSAWCDDRISRLPTSELQQIGDVWLKQFQCKWN